jgi:tetratricopeptide (TPR) repeat protein
MPRSVLTALVCLVVFAAAPGTAGAQTLKPVDDATRLKAFREYKTARDDFRSERWDEAEVRLQQVVRLEPLFVAAHYLLGRTQMEMERYRSAVLSYLAAERAAVTLAAQSRSQMMRGAADDRLMRIEGVRDEPQGHFAFPAELPLALGTAYHRLGETEQAEREYLTAIEINKRLGEAHNNLAVLYLQQGRVSDAKMEASLAEKFGFRLHPHFKDELYASR